MFDRLWRRWPALGGSTCGFGVEVLYHVKSGSLCAREHCLRVAMFGA